eukprot:766529-Hanusia_phi.AAC.3
MIRKLDIVLDEVDGGILEVTNSSDVSCTPSPRHISIPRTPRLASSPSTPITPEHLLKRHLVEVLMHGFMRKPSSSSFQPAVAWFPAEAYELDKDSEDSPALLRVRLLDAYDSFFEWVPLSSVRIPADVSASPSKFGEDIEVGDKICGRKIWFCAKLNESQALRGLRSLSSRQVVFLGDERSMDNAVTFQDVRKRTMQDPVNEAECLRLLRLSEGMQGSDSPIAQPRFLGDVEQAGAKPDTELKSIFFHSETSSATLDYMKKVKLLLEDVSELFCEREALMLHNFVLDQGEEGWSSSFRRLTGNQVRGADMKCVGYFISGCIEHLEQAEISKQSNAVKLLLAASLGLTQLSTKLVIFVQTSLIAKDIVVLVTSSLMRCLCKLSDADENMTPEAECVELRKLGSLLSDLLFVVLSVLKNFVTKRDEKMHGIMMDCYNRINSGQADINEHVQSVVLLLCTDEIPVEQGCFLIFIIDLLNLQIHSETRFPVPYKKILCNMEILLFLVTFASEKLPEGKPAGDLCPSSFRLSETRQGLLVCRVASASGSKVKRRERVACVTRSFRDANQVPGRDSQMHLLRCCLTAREDVSRLGARSVLVAADPEQRCFTGASRSKWPLERRSWWERFAEGGHLSRSQQQRSCLLLILAAVSSQPGDICLIVVLLKFLLASSVNTKEVEDESVEISSPPVHDMASDIAFDSAGTLLCPP